MNETPIASRESVPTGQMESTESSLQELRVRVAKLRGTAYEELGIRYRNGMLSFGQSEEYTRQKCANYQRQGLGCELITRMTTDIDYCNDLNACAELIDLLADKGWTCRLDNGLDKTWECTFETGTSGHKDFRQRYYPADKLAVAICRAFVAVMEASRPKAADSVPERVSSPAMGASVNDRTAAKLFDIGNGCPVCYMSNQLSGEPSSPSPLVSVEEWTPQDVIEQCMKSQVHVDDADMLAKSRNAYLASLTSRLEEAEKALNEAGVPIGDEHRSYSLPERIECLSRVKTYFVEQTDSLRASLAVAERDRERLDWLAQRCYLPGDHPDKDILVVVDEKWAPLGAFTCNPSNDSKALREAIDSAKSNSGITDAP